MATKKKLLQAAAGSAGGAGADVSEVFSTTLYETNNTNITVTTGLDGTGSEKVLYWSKPRVDAAQDDHSLVDNERQSSSFARLASNRTDEESTSEVALYQFTSTGYLAGQAGYFNGNLQGSNSGGGVDQVTWGFKEAPKFFDIQTWTGDGTSGRNISHNLGSVPGHIIVKKRSGGSAAGWINWHRTFSDYQSLFLNTTEAVYNPGTLASGVFGQASNMTSTQFQLGGTNNITYHNENNSTYVAYLFAHNNSDGEFGPDADQDIIKCGSFSHNYNGAEVNLGFEPQWILLKAKDQTGNWYIFDAMRGIFTGGLSGDGDAVLIPNRTNTESVTTWGVDLTSTGFIVYGNNILSSGDAVYVAIRRGPLAEPESATDVFAIDTYGGTAPTPPLWNSGFPVDMAFYKHKGNTTNFVLSSRPQQGKYLITDSTAAESTLATLKFDFQNGYFDATGTDSNYVSWMWKRAPGFFDVVCHTGDGTADRAIAHNLGQVPRLRITKARQSTTYDSWWVYYIDSGGTQTRATLTQSPFYSNTDVVSTATNIYPDVSVTNASGIDYVHFLFGEISGISKISTYTGNGGASAINVDCGFSSGARFVLIKSKTESTNWVFYDSVRGIVSGNDPYLLLNLAQAEVTGTDYIDPLSSGFTVSTSAPTSGLVSLNANNVEYVFYAIA